MRKYFIFKHPLAYGCKKGTTVQIEVYSFADILNLLSHTELKIESARIMQRPLNVRNVNHEWSNGAYQIMGMCDGMVKCIGVTNFKE